MKTTAPQYEHIPTATRSAIRHLLQDAMEHDPRPNATHQERLERAVRQQARRYGVKQVTIRRIWADKPLMWIPLAPPAMVVEDRSGASEPSGPFGTIIEKLQAGEDVEIQVISDTTWAEDENR